MRICLIGPKTCPPELGGIEVFAFEIGRRLASKGVDVSIVSSRRKGQTEEERVEGIDVQRIWAIQNRYSLKLSMIPGILAAMKRIGPDVIHANDATSAYASSTMLNAKRTIVTVHGIGYTASDWRFPFRQGISILQKLSVRKAAAVVATDTNTSRQLSSIRQDIRVIPPGVDTELFKRGGYKRPEVLSEDKINILYVGRLATVKGADLLTEALKVMDVRARSRISITVIGEGPLATQIKTEASRGAPLTLMGPLPHDKLPPYFANADFLIMPSRSEGLPISLLEAMSSNLPVVCSLVGGIGTYFNQRLLTPIERLDPEGVAKAIGAAMNNRAEIGRKALEARRYIDEKFSWNILAEKYLDVYKQVLENSPT